MKEKVHEPGSSPGDMLFGSIVLIIFLVCVLGAGILLSRFKNRRFTQAWAPLVSLIHGFGLLPVVAGGCSP